MKNLKTVFFVLVVLVHSLPAWSGEEKTSHRQPHKLITSTTEFQIAYGNPEAPVVLKEYSSLTCPHCRDFHDKIIDKIKTPYIDSGKVYYLFRFFPLDIPALKASMLVHCLNDTNQKMDFITELFEKQPAWTSGETELEFMEDVTAIARKKGIDTSGFQHCVNDESLEEKMLSMRMQLIDEAGIRTTPTIFINNEEYLDQRALKEITSALESALESTKQQKKRDG